MEFNFINDRENKNKVVTLESSEFGSKIAIKQES